MAALRKEKQLTQEQLGELLGVSSRSVSRWETGRNMPDISLLQSISSILGCSISELLEGKMAQAAETQATEETVTTLIGYASLEQKTQAKKRSVYSMLAFLCLLLVLLNKQFSVFDIIFREEASAFVDGAFSGLSLLLFLIGQYNNCHALSVRQRKKALMNKLFPRQP